MEFFKSKNVAYIDLALQVFLDFEEFGKQNNNLKKSLVIVKNGSKIFNNFFNLTLKDRSNCDYIKSLNLDILPHHAIFLKNNQMTAFLYHPNHESVKNFECIIRPENIKYSKIIINKEYGTLSHVNSYHEAMDKDCAVMDDNIKINSDTILYKQVQFDETIGIVQLRSFEHGSIEIKDFFLPL